jgi:hypothetical protein
MVGTVALLMAFPLCTARPEEKKTEDKEEMVVNPFYKGWAHFAPGATAVHVETTQLGGESKEQAPDGVDEKEIRYKLLEVTPKKAVVEVVVVEREFLSIIEAAPTKITYPAKVKKSHLDAVLLEIGAKRGEETLMVAGKELKCKTVAGTRKKKDEEIKHKIWYSFEIPGGIVKKTRTTRQDGKLVAETTVTLKKSTGVATKIPE